MFPISTSFRILTINFSFMIRFELFKLLIKIDFKETQTYRNRNRNIQTLSGPKIHSKWGHVQANSCINIGRRVVRVVSDVS